MEKIKIGIIGCGNISQAYFNGAKIFKNIEVVACADLNRAAADAKATENNVKAMGVEELLADRKIDIVLNLTIPKVHAELNMRILEAGKHAYCEKPLAVTKADAERTLALAKKKKLRVGCAPDTFLGAGLQTCRKVIDDGWIGRPIGGTAFMMGHGPEAWHPNPMFFYEKGAGPMLDMGPYYVTALIHLLGPVKSVCATTAISFPERVATCEQHFGRRLSVEVQTHLSGTLEFVSGALVTMVMSFDVWRHGHSPIEIYGSEGSMQVPDPNTFGGPVRLFRPGAEAWADSVLTHKYAKGSRSIGMADMAKGIQDKRPHRCSGDLAYHALDVMLSFEESSKTRRHVELKSQCDQPKAFPTDQIEGVLD